MVKDLQLIHVPPWVGVVTGGEGLTVFRTEQGLWHFAPHEPLVRAVQNYVGGLRSVYIVTR
jgi:hypothetical protein